MRVTRARSLLLLTITLLIVAIALYFQDWRVAFQALGRTTSLSVVLCLLFSVLSQIAVALRWGLIAAPYGQAPRLGDCLTAAHGSLFNMVTPSAVGTDLFKLLRRDKSTSRLAAVGLVLFDRLLGIWSFSALYLACFGVDWLMPGSGPRLSSPMVASLGVFTVLTVGFPLLIAIAPLARRRIGSWEGRVGSTALALIGAQQRWSMASLWGSIVLALLAGLAWLGAAFSVLQPLDGTLTFPRLGLTAIITEMSRILPISLQGIGVREVTFAWLAEGLGASYEAAFVACFLLYVVNYVAVLIVGGGAGLFSTLAGAQAPTPRADGNGPPT